MRNRRRSPPRWPVRRCGCTRSRGLVTPDRTDGGTRRYSQDDVVTLQRIQSLLGAGLNLAGVAMVLALEADNAQLRRDAGE